MKKILLFAFLVTSIFSYSQELNEAFLDSLPASVKDDVLSEIDNKKQEEKAIYRKKYDDIYLMSSKKNAGKIGSKVILKHMNG